MKIKAEKSRYHRFALYYDFTPERVEFCRVLKDSFGWQKFSFDSTDGFKRWTFSDSFFLKLLVERFPETEVDPEVMSIWQNEQGEVEIRQQKLDTATDIQKKEKSDLKISGLKGDPYTYQKIDIEFYLASGGRALNASSPGVGKSLTVLGYIVHEKFERVLVVCPSSVKWSWEGEVAKWTHLKSYVINSQTDLRDIPYDVQVWICNYDILKKFLPELLKTKFAVLVGDEIQMCKNPKALRTKAFTQLSRGIPHILLLTGTPIINRPIEAFTLLNILDRERWNNWYDYARRYAGMKQTRWGLDTSGATNLDELHERIKGYFIRHTKEEVLKELPPKNFIDFPIELSKETLHEYGLAEQNLIQYLKEKGKSAFEIAGATNAEMLVKLNILRQISVIGKIPAAIELIENIIDGGEKVVVFSSFKEPLRQLYEHFSEQAVMITGDTPNEDRRDAVNSFQKNPDIKVFFGGYLSAGSGITLTAASSMVMLDLPWAPGHFVQASNRCHRPGAQYESLNIYTMISRDTIDIKMQALLNKKQKIFDQMIDGGEIDKDKDETLFEVVNDIKSRRESGFTPMDLTKK